MTVKSMTFTERGIMWLQKANVRVTRQRVALAELLVGDGLERHVCAESLYEEVARTEASVSLATIYNTLRTFCDAGLLTEIRVDSHKSYFDTRIDDHPHYYLEDEGVLIDAPIDAVKFAKIAPPPEGHEIYKIDVLIRLRGSEKPKNQG